MKQLTQKHRNTAKQTTQISQQIDNGRGIHRIYPNGNTSTETTRQHRQHVIDIFH